MFLMNLAIIILYELEELKSIHTFMHISNIVLFIFDPSTILCREKFNFFI